MVLRRCLQQVHAGQPSGDICGSQQHHKGSAAADDHRVDQDTQCLHKAHLHRIIAEGSRCRTGGRTAACLIGELAQPLKAGSEGTLYDDSEYGYYGPPSFAEEKGVEGFNGGSTGGDTTSSYDNECALSKDEAIKKAEEFQNKLGMASQVYIGTSDYEWSAGVIEDGDETVKTDDKESVIKDTAWGYIIDYGEGVDGIAFCKSLDFTRNMDIWDTLDNYDDFMPYGSSSFIVTDQGVTEFTVSYPVDIVNESKNVELLSMDTIKEIIKDDMTKNSDQYDFTQNHTYNNLKLGYIRLKDASDKDKCTYVPAWCLSKQDKGYDRYPVYVNAIDGTIIRSDDLI